MRRQAMNRLFMCAAATVAGVAWTGSPTTFEHDDLHKILVATVRGEGVDYAQVRDAHLDALDGYLARAAGFDTSVLPRDEHLALLINIYNATMVRAVAERFSPRYSPSDDDFKIFDEKLVGLNGGRISLNDLEHKIIRPNFGDPRIHAALVCAAKSCPPLIARAYRAADLDQILEENMRRFLNDATRNQIDTAQKALQLSQIFEWYAEDFGGTTNLPAYVSRFAGRDVSAYSVSYMAYDWALNLADPTN